MGPGAGVHAFFLRTSPPSPPPLRTLRFPNGESGADVYDRMTIFEDHLVRTLLGLGFGCPRAVAMVWSTAVAVVSLVRPRLWLRSGFAPGLWLRSGFAPGLLLRLG